MTKKIKRAIRKVAKKAAKPKKNTKPEKKKTHPAKKSVKAKKPLISKKPAKKIKTKTKAEKSVKSTVGKKKVIEKAKVKTAKATIKPKKTVKKAAKKVPGKSRAVTARTKNAAGIKRPAKSAVIKKPTVKKSTEKKQGPNKPVKGINDPALEKIRQKMIYERNDLLRLISSSQEIERNVGELAFSNEIDLASNLEGREMAFQLSSRERNELRLMDEALYRMSVGGYGVCESCSKKIGTKRLQIMPLTSLCIDCQESAESS